VKKQQHRTGTSPKWQNAWSPLPSFWFRLQAQQEIRSNSIRFNSNCWSQVVNWLTTQFYNSRLYLPGFSLSKNTLLRPTGQCAGQLWHWIKVAESTSWQVIQVTTSIISTPKHVCKPRSAFQDHYDTALSDSLNFYFFLQLENRNQNTYCAWRGRTGT
jgi:hypothetical protein